MRSCRSLLPSLQSLGKHFVVSELLDEDSRKALIGVRTLTERGV